MLNPSTIIIIASSLLRYITDPGIITKKVKEAVTKAKPGELIRGGHWEHEMFYNRQWPTGSAHAEFMEDRKGMIKEGYFGDGVIFNNDLMTITRYQIQRMACGILVKSACSLLCSSGR